MLRSSLVESPFTYYAAIYSFSSKREFRLPLSLPTGHIWPVNGSALCATYDVIKLMPLDILDRRMVTWEMLLKGKSTKALPSPLALIERKSIRKLLGVTFQSNPCNWDLRLDNILWKASSRLHIWTAVGSSSYPFY